MEIVQILALYLSLLNSLMELIIAILLVKVLVTIYILMVVARQVVNLLGSLIQVKASRIASLHAHLQSSSLKMITVVEIPVLLH